MELQDMFISVAGRSTRPAWEKLKDLSDHLLFEALVANLHEAPGTIAEFDVDKALADLMKVPCHWSRAANEPHSLH